MITIKLNVTKFEKDRFHRGKKGIYADLALVDHPNDYGDDGFVVQTVTKEQYDAGERGPIVGNWRETNKKPAPKPEPAQTKAPLPEDDDIPF